MRNPTAALTAAMSAEGFVWCETGGGCSAWIRHNAGGVGSIWITEGPDPLAPLTLSAPVTLGVYGEDVHADPIALFFFPSVRTALRWLE
jgi:hypothetical protein